MASRYHFNLNYDTVCFSGKKSSLKEELLELPPDCFPSEGLREFMLNELNNPDNDKTVLEIHSEYYSELLDCTALKEAKEHYSEFKRVIDAKI